MSFLSGFFKKKTSSNQSASKAPASAKPDNTRFVEAIDAVGRDDTPTTRRALYEAMRNAWFFIPSPTNDKTWKPGHNVADGKAPLAFPIIHDRNAKKLIPTFTDEEALTHWATRSSQWVALEAIPFFRLIIKLDVDEIAVNPPPLDKPPIRAGGRITRLEFTALADGLIPEANFNASTVQMKVARTQRVLIGIPAKMPSQEIFEALSKAAAAHPIVRSMYFCLLTFDESAPHNAVAIELPSPPARHEVEQALGALSATLHPWLAKNEFLDFFPCEKSPFLAAIQQKGKQFYVAPPL